MAGMLAFSLNPVCATGGFSGSWIKLSFWICGFSLNPVCATGAFADPRIQLSYWVCRVSLNRPIVLKRKRFVNQFPVVKRAFTRPLSNETSNVFLLTSICPFLGALLACSRKWVVNDTSAM